MADANDTYIVAFIHTYSVHVDFPNIFFITKRLILQTRLYNCINK